MQAIGIKNCIQRSTSLGLNNIGLGPSGVVGVSFVNFSGVWKIDGDSAVGESTTNNVKTV